MLQLNQKHMLISGFSIPREGTVSPQETQLAFVESSLFWCSQFCLIFSKELFAEGHSPPGLILSELPRPGSSE